MHNKIYFHLVQRWWQLAVILLASCVTASPVKAQLVPPTLVPPRRPETPTLPAPSLLPPSNNLLQPSAPPPSASQAFSGTITVSRFVVVGSTVFSHETLAKRVAGFIGKPLSFSELSQAAEEITKLYTDKGYITSGAVIPPQNIQQGVVTIKVSEGRLERIQVTGTRRLNPNYVRRRLAIAASKPVNRSRLLEALQMLQLNPLIKNISANISPGSRPDTRVLNVQVTEAKTFSSQLTLDNDRPPTVGTFQRGVQLGEANLLGQGDGLSIGYSNTDGSNNLNANYTLPLNPRNGTLAFNYASTWSHVIAPPFNNLQIRENFRSFDIVLRQPLLQTPAKELAFGFIASRRESDASILGSHLLGREISPGADNQGRTRVSALRFFQEWTKRNRRQVLAFRSQFSLGIGALDATIHKVAPDGRFFAWQGQGQWVRLFAPDTLLLVRGAVQVASRPLVPLEQFELGGPETVRGYSQDFLLTDSGASASAEFRVPVLRISRNNIFQLTPFVEFGYGWNAASRIRVGPNNTLASVGIGLRWQIGNNFSARLDYGIPLVDVPSRNRTLQEQGLFFSVQYSPF